MKSKFLTLPLCLAALGLTSGPGVAGGDWTDDGITNYNRSVPVPAPIPVPVNAAQWYLRGDLAYAAASTGSVDALGYPVDTFDYGSGDGTHSYGFGIGYYLSRSFRLEVAGDWSSERTTSRHSEGVTQSVDVVGPDHPTVVGTTSVDTLHYSGEYDHKSTLHSSALLINLYYDLETGSRFKPYIGGGLGLSVHRLRVTGDSTLNCQSLDRDYTPDPGVLNPPQDQVGMNCGNNPASGPIGSSDGNTNTIYGLAATAMAGVAIEISPGINWDTGYRFIYRGGTPSINFHTPTSEATIDIGERTDHEIRTGIRFDIF
ncbi:MAG: outer membrane beta-barrel protein [Hyphomicrobium sp.]